MNTGDWEGLTVHRRQFLAGVSGVAFGAAMTIDGAAAAAGDYADVAESVRLTPEPAATDVGGARSLSGTWDFTLAGGDAPPTEEDWDEEPVPGQWGYDGFEDLGDWYPPEGQRGWYRRDVEVPSDWAGGRVVLRFDAVYSAAEVFVDGERVAEHVGGYTAFEVDVTEAVTAGETATVAVAVAQRSASDDMAWQNVTAGIPRDVRLVGVPETHLADVTVRTSLADDGASATVAAEVTVRNDGSSSVDGATLSATLTGPDGSTVGTATADVPSVPAGETGTTTLEVDVSEPATWTPEQPRLHDVDVELQAGETTERVRERFGVRTVEVVENELHLNGTPVTLRGVNWEEIHLPEHGHAVPEALTREDARRLKEANVNFVRTAHHPTSEAFIAACDELGIVVEVEAPHTFVGGQRGDAVPDVVVSQSLETVERDVNHPSVCVWSIANESGWFDVFGDTARLVDERDGTRPLVFEVAEFEPDAFYLDQYEIGVHHYPAFRDGSTVDMYADEDQPMLYGEYAHTYCYNGLEVTTDPGMRDQWGWLFDRVWSALRETESAAGAALWAGGDHLERWGEYRWGVVDRYRRPRPEYWHLKQTYSPVRVAGEEWADDGSSVAVTLENRHEFVSLVARTVTSTSGGEETTHDLSAAPGETETVTVPVPGDEATLTVTHPQGHVVTQARFEPPTSPPEPPAPAEDASVDAGEETIEVSAGDWVLTVARSDGSTTVGPAGDDPVVVDTPSLALSRTQSSDGGAFNSILDHRTFQTTTEVAELEEGTGVRIEAGGTAGTVTYELRPLEGGLEVTYTADLSSVSAREVGLTVPVASGAETLSWDRQALWRAYPEGHIGRSAGTAEAFPSGSRPDSPAMEPQTGQPWAADTTTHGSNDFRSTKRNVETATLTDGDGRGVRVVSDGSQHVRAQVRDERVDLLVLERSLSGANPPGWLNRYAAAGENPDVSGTVDGQVTLDLVGDASGGSGTTTADETTGDGTTARLTPTPTGTPTGTDTGSGGGGVPGFTAELALAALAGLAALAAHRAD